MDRVTVKYEAAPAERDAELERQYQKLRTMYQRAKDLAEQVFPGYSIFNFLIIEYHAPQQESEACIKSMQRVDEMIYRKVASDTFIQLTYIVAIVSFPF